MALQLTFGTPVACGQYPNQVQLSAVALRSLVLSFDCLQCAAGTAQLQMTLECPQTARVFTTVRFADAASLALIQAMLAATNPATGNTFEHDLLTKAQTATVAGKAMLPTAAIGTVAVEGGKTNG